MIDAGEWEVFVREVPQFLERGLGRDPAGGDIGEKGFNLLGGHAT